MTEENRAFNPGPYRPRPQGKKPTKKKASGGSSASRLVFLLALLAAVAVGAWARYFWHDPVRQEQLREWFRPPGKISIHPVR